MREAFIGIVTALFAVAAFNWLRGEMPRRDRPVTQVWSGDTFPTHRTRNTAPTTGPSTAQLKLDRSISVVFDQVPFIDAVRHVTETTGANIWINWRVIEAAGIDRTRQVTLDLQDVNAWVALRLLLREVETDTTRLGFRCEDSVVRISTQSDLHRDTITRIYDVRDLFVVGSTPARKSTTGSVESAEQEALDQLVRLIQETIDPTLWYDAGGSVGSIRALRGCLVVTQTPENHDKLVELLNALRHPSKP